MPYSISTKRTRRGLQKTRSLRSTNSRSVAAERRAWRPSVPSPGSAGRPGTPCRRRGSRRSTCRGRRPADPAAPRLLRALVALHLAAPRPRHPVQLEVIDGRGLSGEVVEHVVEHLDRSHGRGGGTPARTAASPPSRRPARRGRPGRRAARRAARRRARTMSPVPVTSSMPTTVVARLPYSSPVPCVAVAIAPAIDWRSMSPRLGIARPASASTSLRRRERMPAPT